MCVIIYKPAAVKISGEDLHNMWETNSDGAGIAYKIYEEGKPVRIAIERGFMNYKALKRRVKELEDIELCLHFRKRTHGKTIPEMTHPFPLLPIEHEDHKKTEIECPAALMHNGVLSRFGNEEISDTMDFAANVISKLDQKTIFKVLESVSGKYCLILPEQIWLFGDFTPHEGLKCSNLHWKPWKTSKHQPIGYQNTYYNRETNTWNREWKNDEYWNKHKDEVWDYKQQKYVPRQKSEIEQQAPQIEYKAAAYTKQQEISMKPQASAVIDLNEEERLRRIEEQLAWEEYWEQRGYGSFEM